MTDRLAALREKLGLLRITGDKVEYTVTMPGYQVDAIISILADLVQELGTDIIGDDFPKPPLGDFWNVGRNQLKADMRDRLRVLTDGLRNKEEL